MLLFMADVTVDFDIDLPIPKFRARSMNPVYVSRHINSIFSISPCFVFFNSAWILSLKSCRIDATFNKNLVYSPFESVVPFSLVSLLPEVVVMAVVPQF